MTSDLHMILSALAMLTIIAGCIGALAYFDVKQIIIYNIVIAVGVILFGAAQMNESGLTGAVFYLNPRHAHQRGIVSIDWYNYLRNRNVQLAKNGWTNENTCPTWLDVFNRCIWTGGYPTIKRFRR